MKYSIKTITPQLASELLKNNNNNRSLSPHTVDNYAKEMLAGKWENNGEAIKIDSDGNLLDGQHRLSACVKSGVAFDALIITDLPRRVFATLDTGKKRSASDILTVEGYKYTATLSSVAKFLMLWEKGERSINIYNAGTGHTNNDVLAFVRANPDLPAIVEMCRTDFARFYRLAGANGSAGLFYLFNKKDPELAFDFFQRLSSGECKFSKDTIFLLREKLIDMVVSSKGLRAGCKLQLIIRAWNRLRSGETTGSVLYSPDRPIPDIK